MNIWDNKRALEQAIQQSHTLTETIERLGMSPKSATTRKKLNKAIEKFEINTSHLTHTGRIPWRDKAFIEEIVKYSKTFRDVMKRLGLRDVGANNKTFKKWVKFHNIDMSHFDPISDKMEKLRIRNSIPTQEILNGQHPTFPTFQLKRKLLKEGIKENQCEECGQEETWNNKPLKMHLDHIDGNPTNHKLPNLRVLCPNCHSQTLTYSGRNKQFNSSDYS